MANAENINTNVQGILHDSLSSVGGFSSAMMRREGSTLSVASLPATIMAPKPFFKSKIPVRHGQSSSGRSTPLNGSRSDLSKLRNNLSSPVNPMPVPPAVPPKPKLASFQKTPLRREISSPPSLLNERRGSMDSFCHPKS